VQDIDVCCRVRHGRIVDERATVHKLSEFPPQLETRA
jgi:hypothetical protein